MKLIVSDCRTALAAMPENTIDSCVTDPPYDLTSIVKRFGGPDSKPATAGPYARTTRGFMGKQWDGTGVAFDPETWAVVLRVLKPGAYLLAFGGSRTHHRMACAIEDAGFEIRDCLMWIYGSGFPKSLNCGEGRGTALKPAYEPIIMARKPLIGSVADNLEEFGTGAINIDACRVGTSKDVPASAPKDRLNASGFDPAVGRWPANVIHDGSEEVLAAFPDAGGQQGVSTGDRRGPSVAMGAPSAGGGTYVPREDEDESKSAARFFYCAKASRADREEGCEGLPLMSGGELTGRKDGSAGLNSPRAGAVHGGGRRNHHPTVKPTALMRYLVRLVTPSGGTVLDPFMGSGSTGKAAALEGRDFVGIDMSAEYARIAAARVAWALVEQETGAAP